MEVTTQTIEAHEQEKLWIQNLRVCAIAGIEALTESYDKTSADLSAEHQRHSTKVSKLKRELESASQAIQTLLDHSIRTLLSKRCEQNKAN